MLPLRSLLALHDAASAEPVKTVTAPAGDAPVASDFAAAEHGVHDMAASALAGAVIPG